MVRATSLELTALRELCAKYWNPIGVVMAFEAEAKEDPSPMPADEYDPYLLAVLQMIGEDASRQEVISYLSKVESEYIGLSQPAGDKARFVDAAFALMR